MAATLALAAGCSDADLRPVAGVLELRPGRLDLGLLPAGYPEVRTLVLANVGDDALTWRARADDDALHLSSAGGRLQGGQTASVVLTTQPRAAGPLDAYITFTTDSEASPAQVLAVTASVAPEALVLTPDPLGFGAVRVGRRGERTLRLQSFSPDPLRLSLALEAADPGFEAPVPAELDLEPGGVAEVRLGFAPDREGAARARLAVTGGCASCARAVALSAEGVPASLVCSPAALEFGLVNPDTAVSRNLTCTNIAAEPVILRRVGVAPEPGPFSIDPPVLPLTLAAGRAVSLDVAFHPASPAWQAALLTWEVLEGDVGVTRTTVGLSGRGGGPDLRASTALLYFGGAVVGAAQARALTLTNVGDAALTLGGATTAPSSAPFALQAPLPSVLYPGEAATASVLFTPAATGEARAVLRVASDDPDQPQLEVVLEGAGLPPGTCSARLEPEASSFGLVRVGSEATADLVLSAGPDAACAWFDPRIEGDAPFGFVSAPPRSGVLGPSQARVFSVRYAPLAPSPDAGHHATFRVDLPHLPARALETPLVGVSAASDLVVFPSAVDFEALPVGLSRSRPLFLHNTGAQTHTLTDVSLLDAAPGLTVTALPLPVILRPGEATRVDLAYAPVAAGRLQTQVALQTDRLPAAVRVAVVGDAVEVSCGRLAGEVCLPGGLGPAVGATVEITGADGRRVEATTDEDGRYLSPCVPPGPAEVTVRRGHYERRAAAAIAAGRVTTLPATPCLAPPPAGRVRVVTGAFDRIEGVLSALGVGHTTHPGGGGSAAILLDPGLADVTDLLLVNCGADDARARDPAVAENLRRFVLAGGSLYVSDLAYDLVEAAFPEALALSGDDAVPDAAEVGRVLEFTAQVLAPELLRGLGQGRLPVALDGDYAVVEAAGPGAAALVVGPSAGPSQGLAPLVVRYRPTPTSGVVIFTTLHDSAAVADPRVRQLLALLVLSL